MSGWTVALIAHRWATVSAGVVVRTAQSVDSMEMYCPRISNRHGYGRARLYCNQSARIEGTSQSGAPVGGRDNKCIYPGEREREGRA